MLQQNENCLYRHAILRRHGTAYNVVTQNGVRTAVRFASVHTWQGSSCFLKRTLGSARLLRGCSSTVQPAILASLTACVDLCVRRTAHSFVCGSVCSPCESAAHEFPYVLNIPCAEAVKFKLITYCRRDCSMNSSLTFPRASHTCLCSQTARRPFKASCVANTNRKQQSSKSAAKVKS